MQLQERNRLMKAFQQHHPPKDKDLKQRETGFQLYLNGAHGHRPRRPPSIISTIYFQLLSFSLLLSSVQIRQSIEQ